MNPAQFVAKWSRVDLPERAASQEHFLDLCRLLGQPTPAEHDATGAEYAFEKGVEVAGSASKGSKGDRGFADVWWKNKFGWEYKRKDKYKSLDEAYRQLLQYREALESPPLLIVSDIGRTEIHTNFTGTKKDVYTIALADMDQPSSIDLLRRVFSEPESFRPSVTAELITKQVAARLGEVAEGLRKRGNDPHATAHFLMKCMFCLFAEDVSLLPGHLFKKLLVKFQHEPKKLTPRLDALFAAMREGGAYGNDDIAFFNGGLFDEAPALELNEGEVALLNLAAAQDWGSVEPAVFGTLFERSLDPAKRSQIGAHYTSREDILLVVEPVIMEPLRTEWAATRAKVAGLLEKRAGLMKKAATDKTPGMKKQITKVREDIEKPIGEFLDRLSGVRVLDPACGSGNFLYIAIQRLLDLEKEVITFAAKPEIGLGLLPQVRPTQLHGIEINPYASELAQVVIWIGYLQWMRDNGFNPPSNPILSKLRCIQNRDAILQMGAKGESLRPAEDWPPADFIIGNPPFLGSTEFKKAGIPKEYKDAFRSVYSLRGKSDLCCAWFERARWAVNHDAQVRVGLLGNTTIRFGVARDVLDRIVQDTTIFRAWSNRKWDTAGASVRTCFVCFSGEAKGPYLLDGQEVDQIGPTLQLTLDVTSAQPLPENLSLSFEGDQKGGPFDLAHSDARRLLALPSLGKSKTVPLRRRMTYSTVAKTRYDGGWVIDFGPDATLAVAAQHDAVMKFLEEAYLAEEKETRDKGIDYSRRNNWWIHKCARPEMLAAIKPLRRILVTGRVGTYRIFRFIEVDVLPDSRLVAFGRDDDYFFGVLQSSLHAHWALVLAPPHGVGNDPTYNNTRCFETFPLPWAPGREPSRNSAYRAISAAAEDLDTQRERWLNPPEWIEPIAKRIDAADKFEDVPAAARALIRQSAIMSAAAADPKLKKRTLTNLYNERPTWLRLAHERLDRAVLAAYGAVDPKGGWNEDWAEVWVETGAGAPLPPGHALEKKREEVEERVLGNLLRMNGERK